VRLCVSESVCVSASESEGLRVSERDGENQCGKDEFVADRRYGVRKGPLNLLPIWEKFFFLTISALLVLAEVI